jgi:cysteine desulfurase/selenocysteine lyase
MGVDVQEYDCDFFVFSGHKVYAPTGIGVLYGKEEILNAMPPWQGGGNMIHDVTFERTIYQAAPLRFEAGTGNIADAVGLAAALDYITQIGMRNVSAHEEELLAQADYELSRIPGLKILGKPEKRAGVISFVLDGYRTEEVSQFLNQYGIAVRAGHHCAQPILRRFGVESSVRPSFGIYNTCEEVDVLAETLLQLVRGRRVFDGAQFPTR